MRWIHSARKSRLRTLRERYMCIHACCTASLAAAWQLERLPRKPFAALRMRLRRRRALKPLLARGIGVSYLLAYAPYGSIATIWWCCSGPTMPAARRWRLRFCARTVMLWRLFVFWYLNLPVPVDLKRFFAPVWVFILILGMTVPAGRALCTRREP